MKKLCINCAHHRRSDRMIKNESYERCSHPDIIDPVTGEAASCYVARERDGACGAEGALFAQKALDPIYFGDDYPRDGCTLNVDVEKGRFKLVIYTTGGDLIESYAHVDTPEQIGRMVAEWCQGRAPKTTPCSS